MRNAFARELVALAETDERVVLLSGDIGNRMFDTFKSRFPDRFYNCGVAEANMLSVAAGLGLCGLRPVVYTIVPFVTTRCLEQIRVDVCYHRSPVTIVGVGGGLSYASLGATHHSCEDIGFLRMLPEMTVVCPADACEVRLGLRAALQQDGPVYLRIGKKGEPAVHERDPDFVLGQGITLRSGTDVCLLATGNIVPLALETADHLQQDGLTSRVVSLHTVKPLDADLLAEVFARFPLVITLEEHSLIGGLGGAVAEWYVDRSEYPVSRSRLLRIGTADRFLHAVGDQDYARRQFGLESNSIAQRIKSALEHVQPD